MSPLSQEEYLFAGLSELGGWLRSGKCSSEDLAAAALQALEERARPLNAVVNLASVRALEEAKEATSAFAAGQVKSFLQGIPYGAKDLLATGGGLPTTWGAAPLKDQQFSEDATVIRLLKESGAVLTAKIAMVELAGGMGYNQPNASLTGPCRNPWNREHWTGGSSSGSGAAVGCGALPYAIGSETMGSILSPASYCGVVGFRPTYGLVSRSGAMALSWSMDKIGPLARSAADCARVMEIIGKPDNADITSSGRSFQYRPELFKDRRWRFGVLKSEMENADDAVGRTLENTLPVLQKLGTVTEITLPSYPYIETARLIFSCEAASSFEDLLDSGKMGGLTAPEDRITPYTYSAIPAKDYIRALRIRGKVVIELKKLMEEVDFLVAPTTFRTAPGIEEAFGTNAASRPTPPGLSAASNMAGLPAVSLPIGLDPINLPVGMQLVGRPFADEEVLFAASLIEAELPKFRPR